MQMDDGYGGQFETIYDGRSNNANLSYLKTELVTGMLHRFRVFAVNFNGESQASDITSYYVCTAPAEFAAPTINQQSETQVIIDWLPPHDDGGCSITGYAVFRDDGLGSNIENEVNSDSDTNVRNLPSLDQMTVTSFPDSSKGRTFRFKVQVFTT